MSKRLQTKLERLSLSTITLSGLYHELRNSRSLRALSVTDLRVKPNMLAQPPWHGDQVLSSLRSLHLGLIVKSVQGALPSILDHFRPSSLETVSLRLLSGLWYEGQALANLRPLMAASKLRVLSLHDYPLSDTEMVQLLTRIPSLERLALSYPEDAYTSDNLVDVLRLPVRGAWLLPRLTHLYIRGVASQSQSEASVSVWLLLELVRARRKARRDAAFRHALCPVAALVSVRRGESELVPPPGSEDKTGIPWTRMPAPAPAPASSQPGWWDIPAQIIRGLEYEE
ncbi:hypothetical protein EXIGLDRAFT_753589 [Exidia glandulosa HHB12029]|uniref:F-box domain-containing protein n=1 Tax=Exidia glandulosa HHB12029 TaxID=1314781 RepID=A0A165DM93_EXIGL|nr:hypothetical protein EXIGLDRAFT_753589 [Exidia glandulosa HHB12029]